MIQNVPVNQEKLVNMAQNKITINDEMKVEIKKVCDATVPGVVFRMSFRVSQPIGVGE